MRSLERETHWGSSKDPRSKAWMRKGRPCIMYWFGIQHTGFTTGPLWVQGQGSPQEGCPLEKVMKEDLGFPFHWFLCLLLVPFFLLWILFLVSL